MISTMLKCCRRDDDHQGSTEMKDAVILVETVVMKLLRM